MRTTALPQGTYCRKFFFFVATLLLALATAVPGWTADTSAIHRDLYSRIGEHDAVLLLSPRNKVLLIKNAHTLCIPASTLKIVTALVALGIMGEDYRFNTDFYLDGSRNLIIRGQGDPLLISERILEQLATLVPALNRHVSEVHDIVLDATFFSPDVTIPGVTSSYQPYDAPNGALCVNFNTVFFKRGKDNRYVSGEVQTPLVPQIMKRVRTSGLKKGRIILSSQQNEHILYSGYLYRVFLQRSGVSVNGSVRLGKKKVTDRLLYRYRSPLALTDIIAAVMTYSNNFIANQLLITAGVVRFGQPGTLAKGIRAAKQYIDQRFEKTMVVEMVEGSGISRQNRITAQTLLTVLKRFRPYYRLLRKKGNDYYKTGTLKGIRTRAGYIEGPTGGLYPYVVFLNTPGKTTDPIMKGIRRVVAENATP
jgi:D-alanyl-D-alanine carboxypeptidase/D-alanyl-D-alanine-endopeptidase (penicillin-binding protein 4)